MTAPTSTAPLRTAFTTPFVGAAAEHDAIRETIGHHVDGLGEGSVETLRRGFHPQALVCG